MTDTVERVARAIWPEIGTDYTFQEALDRASGYPFDDNENPEHHQNCIDYAMDLARAAVAAMPAPRVKPLEWSNEGFDRDADEWSAEAYNPIGTYWVIHEQSGCYVYFNKRRILGSNECWERNEAKAAAQADYERRILSALKDTPRVSVAEAARVLLDLLETNPQDATLSPAHIESIWESTFRESGFSAVRGFLEAALSEEAQEGGK